MSLQATGPGLDLEKRETWLRYKSLGENQVAETIFFYLSPHYG